WTDETSTTYIHGSLDLNGWAEETGGVMPDDVAFDTYSLLENSDAKNMVDYPDPTKVQGGAFQDFDNYSVSAQGLGGNMRPYQFQAEILGQNRFLPFGEESKAPSVLYHSPSDDGYGTPEFRFINDFSNSYRQDYNMYTDVTQPLQF